MQIHRLKNRKELKLMRIIGMLTHGDVIIINGGPPEYYWEDDKFWDEDTKLTGRD